MQPESEEFIVLERFRIDGLYGHKTIDVVLEDDTLVVVGENGSGKTTFLRILFHFLAGEWRALGRYQFEEIGACIDGIDFCVSKDELGILDLDRRFLSSMNRLPPSIRRKVQIAARSGNVEDLVKELERMGPRGRHIYDELFFGQMDLFAGGGKRRRDVHGNIADRIEKVRAAIDAQVLYLPTYRRIEEELNAIFSGLEREGLDRAGLPRQNSSDASFVELVEFGMGDVDKAVAQTLGDLKEFARENLNNLTLRYLGDVVDRKYLDVAPEDIAGVSEEVGRSILDRIEESVLTKSAKQKLLEAIRHDKGGEGLSEHGKIIYHYFLKLLGFHQSLKDRERQILDFCDLCSGYIVDKEFCYDSSDFSFAILRKEPCVGDGGDASRRVDFSDLSSGEKQIVSLFSHLYLSGQQKFFVLIDEPELSLSVPWQRRFLEDIRGGQYCTGLVAVTHSPFIYDNSLNKYAHALGEFATS